MFSRNNNDHGRLKSKRADEIVRVDHRHWRFRHKNTVEYDTNCVKSLMYVQYMCILKVLALAKCIVFACACIECRVYTVDAEPCGSKRGVLPVAPRRLGVLFVQHFIYEICGVYVVRVLRPARRTARVVVGERGSCWRTRNR